MLKWADNCIEPGQTAGSGCMLMAQPLFKYHLCIKGYYTVSTIITETSSDNFDLVKYRAFLEHHGVYNQGAWRTECLLQDRTEIPSQHGRYTWIPASAQASCWCHLFASSKIISLHLVLSIPFICRDQAHLLLCNDQYCILNLVGNYVYILILYIFSWIPHIPMCKGHYLYLAEIDRSHQN